jgi:alkylation response protein AidB-like acyl-CoA dehydrogenase
MVTGAVAAHGDDAQRARWLPGLTSGRTLGAYCLTEPGSGSDAASLRTRAEPDPATGGWRLTGEKVFISGASIAGLFLVLARTEPAEAGHASAGISAFLVDASSPGIEVGPPERKMGWRCQPTCSVAFNNVALPSNSMLSAPGRAFGRVALAALDGGRVNIAALSVGGAAAALSKARSYAATRKQFNTPVLDFQATTFALADAATSIHTSRLAVRSAAAALDAKDPTATLQAALAKRHATDACFDAANACLQAFGGYGYLADYAVERIVRDLRVHSILEGTNQVMRLIVGRELDRLDGRE